MTGWASAELKRITAEAKRPISSLLAKGVKTS